MPHLAWFPKWSSDSLAWLPRPWVFLRPHHLQVSSFNSESQYLAKFHAYALPSLCNFLIPFFLWTTSHFKNQLNYNFSQQKCSWVSQKNVDMAFCVAPYHPHTHNYYSPNWMYMFKCVSSSLYWKCPGHILYPHIQVSFWKVLGIH